MKMSILIIDPSISGAAGDMLIAAILDLLNETQRDHFCNEFTSHLIKYDPDFSIKCNKVNINSFSGTQILTTATKTFKPDKMIQILKDMSYSLLKSSVFRNDCFRTSLNGLLK